MRRRLQWEQAIGRRATPPPKTEDMTVAIRNIGHGNSAYEQLRVQQQKELEHPGRDAGGVKESAHTGDNVSVSEDAKLLATAVKVAQDTPDTRADQIARLKEQVASGTYDVSGRTIAEKLVAEELDLFD